LLLSLRRVCVHAALDESLLDDGDELRRSGDGQMVERAYRIASGSRCA
jgi:hypothetical protein